MPISIRGLGLDHLSFEDRLELVEELWDSISAEVEAREIPESHRLELEQRLESSREDPRSGRSWSEVRARLLEADERPDRP